MSDHVHCLFLLDAQKSISEVIKQVKGCTLHWANEQIIILEKFTGKHGTQPIQ